MESERESLCVEEEGVSKATPVRRAFLVGLGAALAVGALAGAHALTTSNSVQALNIGGLTQEYAMNITALALRNTGLTWSVFDDQSVKQGRGQMVKTVQINSVDDFDSLRAEVERQGYAGFFLANNGVAYVYRFVQDGGPVGLNDMENKGPGSGAFFFCVEGAERRYKGAAGAGVAAPVCGDVGPVGRPSRTLYMYRAQSDEDYSFSNVNAADVEGVLDYLHNEVVTSCPRKNKITRILRKKVTFAPNLSFKRNPSRMMSRWAQFQNGFMTQFSNGYTDRDAFDGSVNVGCKKEDYAGLQGYGYSLPGRCPFSLDFNSIYNQYQNGGDAYYNQYGSNPVVNGCFQTQQSGLCDCTQKVGTGSCSYHVEDAGEVYLNDLSGINTDYNSWCAAGNVEYNSREDRGFGTSFWNGKNDKANAARRVEAVKRAFAQKYPHLPTNLGVEDCS